MSKPVIVHVVGTGTIGEPLIGILSRFRADLGIDEVTFHKRTPLTSDRAKVRELVKRGARLAVDADRKADFDKLNMQSDLDGREALERATVVIDCTPIGNKMKEEIYSKLNGSIKGFIAQGSEFGFGKMYARSINDEALEPGKDRFLQVVSCNTHNISVLVKTIGMLGGSAPDNLVEGRFLCIRRATDISQDDDYVPSPMPDKHKHAQFGTHHANDAYHLFETLKLKPKLFSSSMKLNTQYMHTIYFQLKTKEKVSLSSVKDRLAGNPLIALSDKQSANSVFSFGRDHGIYGRILSQTVISTPTLTVKDENEVVGFCFTPQDGNSLLSSISAALWFVDPETYEKRLDCLKPYFFQEV